MTAPGFASRQTKSTFRQFPHRDAGDAVSDIAGMEAPGWSNSNRAVDEEPTEEKALDTAEVEDKSVAKKTTARKAAQKKG